MEPRIRGVSDPATVVIYSKPIILCQRPSVSGLHAVPNQPSRFCLRILQIRETRSTTLGRVPALTVGSAWAWGTRVCCLWCRGGTVIRSWVGDGPAVRLLPECYGRAAVRAWRRNGHRRSRCRSSRVKTRRAVSSTARPAVVCWRAGAGPSAAVARPMGWWSCVCAVRGAPVRGDACDVAGDCVAAPRRHGGGDRVRAGGEGDRAGRGFAGSPRIWLARRRRCAAGCAASPNVLRRCGRCVHRVAARDRF